jgi:hypothetical protein
MTEIELTDAQRQALLAGQGRPLDVVDPTTQQRYVLLAREQYERVRPLLADNAGPVPSPPVAAAGPSPASSEPMRVRLRDLPIPPEVIEETERWCQKYGVRGAKRRREVEDQFKLQYYYGGQAAYVLDTLDGPVVIPVTERYKDTPGLRYVLLTPDERPRACLTVPPRWRDADSEILT